MPRPSRPFHIAFLAIILAVGLPSVVVLFGFVRSRQLQSTANPRWAQFARAAKSAKSSSQVSTLQTSIVPTSTPQARVQSTSLTPTSADSERIPVASFTGSVTGRRTLEAPVTTRSIPGPVTESLRSESDWDVVETPPIIFRPVDEDNGDSPTTFLIGRLESQLTDVRQRLEKLTNQQQEQMEEERLREQQLLVGLKNLHELSTQVREGLETRSPNGTSSGPGNRVSMKTLKQEPPFPPESAEEPQSEVPPFETHPAKPAGEQPYDPDDSAASSQTETDTPVPRETPAPLPTDLPEPEESAIRIRRSTGNDSAETYSIDIQDAEIRQVFSQLSEATEISIVPSPEVHGRISLNLHDVRFDAALNAIIKSRDYVVERCDGILIVRTADEAARRKYQNRQMVMKIYRPNYLSAAELNRLIEPILSPDGRHSVNSPVQSGLSREETNIVDDASVQRDTVIVQDVAEVLDQIDQILVDVDVPPLQVRIEAKILRVRLSEGLKQGLDLGQLPCHQDSGTSFAEGGLKHASLSCNVPTFIRSMERLADTSVVTSQRIQVLNRHRAEMLIGDRIGYQSHAGDDVQFMEAGTRLVLRPSISADGFIRMEIRPELSTATVKRKGAPRQNTAELTTHVMIRDGATVAIAGLIAEQAVETTKRLPLVSAIPVVGAPFRQKKESFQRTELIVLVTPHLVIESESEAEGKCLEQATEERAAEFRDQKIHPSRHSLARAHYERAACYLQQGNFVKARQQIDASLRQNKADLQALRLRNEINQHLMPR